MEKIQLTILFVSIITILLVIIFYFLIEKKNDNVESFIDTVNIPNKKVYDRFYSKIYDQLFFSSYKNEFEINDLINQALKGKKKEQAQILDIGCGTGKHIKILNELGYNPIGLDNSNAMLIIAKNEKANKNTRFVKGCAMDNSLFTGNKFDVISCYYFTIYYFTNLDKFLKNVHYWLKNNGIFVVHVVNKDKFDPILEPASPFPAFSLQKYSKTRITKSTVVFNNFEYTAEFKLGDDNKAKFKEQFFFQKKNKIRKQIHNLNMFKVTKFVKMIKEKYKFKFLGKTDLLSVGYEYQYILYFKKLV